MTLPLDADDFLDLVADLAGCLAEDVSVDEIAARVGRWAPGYPSALGPAELLPVAPSIERAHLACFPDTDLAYALTLVPAPAARPRVAMMRDAWGDIEVGPRHPDTPLELQFATTTVGRHWRVVVLARAQRQGREIDDAVVLRVFLRRDRVV